MHTRLVLALLNLAAAPLAAQSITVGGATQVHEVTFRTTGDLPIAEDTLRQRIATRGRGGMVSVRRALSWVPFVPEVEDRPFDPLELQRDRERLRRFLVRSGYPRAAVDYQVTLDREEDAVDIVFVIDPGTPVRVASIRIEWSDPATPLDPAAAFHDVRRDLELRPGAPLDSRTLPRDAGVVGRWLGDRGYAFAVIRTDIAVDSAADTASVRFQAEVGPRARIGHIEVTGDEGLAPGLIDRFLDIHPGDWFSTRRLAESSARLTTLAVLDRAVYEVPDGQPADTLVNLRLRVQQAVPREISGQAGYSTEGGMGGEVQWTHHNIFGGAQSLTATLAGESAVLALPENANRFVRTSLILRQPVRSSTRLSLLLGPFAEYRDDYHDRSLQLGVEATLLQRLGPLSSVALRYELSTRRIYEYRFGGASGVSLFDLFALSAQGFLDRFGTRINTSHLTLSGSLGTLDAPIEPRRGFVIQPSITATAPAALATNQFVTVNLRTSGYLPLGRRFTLGMRLGGGHLYPVGNSVPADSSEALAALFRLRDELFTAGGVRDVRGWSEGLLGPKLPEIIIRRKADGTVGFNADRFTPIGGFNKAYGTLELRGPMPFLGPSWGSHLFLDAGRIWTTDSRFTSGGDPYGVERLFWATGVGMDYVTPVGAVRVSLGYKLNPSLFDLVDPGELAQALLDGTPIDKLPRHNGRRFQLHLGIGRRL